MRSYIWLGVISILIVLMVGCNQTDQSSTKTDHETNQASELMIYTTVYPLEFLANEIGGDHVQAESILPAGADAHSFEPTSKMMVEIAEADLFIFNDEQSESYAKAIKEALHNETVTFLEASDGLDKLRYRHDHAHGDAEDEHEHEHSEGDLDPHVWMSPSLMNELAENILARLIEALPEEEAYFNKRFEVLSDQLVQLDQRFAETIDQADQQVIFVTHAAYGYWERDYGLKQIAITGLSASEEPSQRQLTQLFDRVEDLEITYLLFEQNIQPQVAQVIQKEVGLDSLELHNLAVLTTEDLTNHEDYFTLMERNIAVLKQALKSPANR